MKIQGNIEVTFNPKTGDVCLRDIDDDEMICLEPAGVIKLVEWLEALVEK